MESWYLWFKLGSLNECDLQVAHRPQWNINQTLTGALVKMYQALEDCGVRAYSTLTMVSAWDRLYNTGVLFLTTR